MTSGWIQEYSGALSVTPILALLALLAFVLFLLHIMYSYVTSPLRKIPAIHWLAHWSRYYNLYIKYCYSTRLKHYEAHINSNNHEGYLPILRIGPNEISIMKGEGVKVVWGGDFERTQSYEVFQNFGKLNTFSFKSSREHAKRKRIAASAYSKTAVSQQRVQELIKARTLKTVRFIDEQVSSDTTFRGISGPIVIRNVFRALQSDIFTAFAFSDAAGTRFLDNLQRGPNTLKDLGMDDMDLFHDEKRDEFFFWESETPFKYISNIVARKGLKAHEKAQQWLSDLALKHERPRLEELDQGLDEKTRTFESGLYDRLLFWRSQETGQGLDWKERASEILDHAGSNGLTSILCAYIDEAAVAGQDAVPAALEYMIRQLCIHPEIQSKLRLELLALVPLNAENRTFKILDDLPYLNAVVMEGLRTVDTISSYQTRVVPKRGCVISGYFLPAGTIVAAQPYLVNRQPDIFPNPNSFDPNRWLLPRESYARLARQLWTYSSGPRSCMGKELSLTIIKTVLVDIYTRYTTKLVNPERTEKRPWEGADYMAEVCFENALGMRSMTNDNFEEHTPKIISFSQM